MTKCGTMNADSMLKLINTNESNPIPYSESYIINFTIRLYFNLNVDYISSVLNFIAFAVSSHRSHVINYSML